MASISDVFQNDAFKQLPMPEQLKVARRFPEFSGLPAKEQGTVLAKVRGYKDPDDVPEKEAGFLETLGTDLKKAFTSVPSASDSAVVGRVKDLGKASKEQFQKGAASFKSGDPVSGTGRMAAAALPGIGPAAAQAGEELGQGEYGRAGAHATELLAPFAVPEALSAAGTAKDAFVAGGKAVGKIAADTKLGRAAGAVSNAVSDVRQASKLKGAVADAAKKRAAQGGRQVPTATPGASFEGPKKAPSANIPAVEAQASELPSGRKVGPASPPPATPVKAPRPSPKWRDAPDSAPSSIPAVEPIKGQLPSGRAPGQNKPVIDAVKAANDSVQDAAPSGRAPRPSDDFYKVHAQVKKAVNSANQLHAQGIKAADLMKLSDDELKQALGKHSRETYNRILFELRGLESGKVKPIK